MNKPPRHAHLRGGQGRAADEMLDMIDGYRWLFGFCAVLAAVALILEVVG